ncbi:MAG: hypothetical protein AUG44_12770 [Actinobacteria bacterium 13_1_20CM_3_71_11]|nr:MAG: hypothetical protein AUG44_12770 [Actinobacteria bacterium 13_1_20CM_3_71_11]
MKLRYLISTGVAATLVAAGTLAANAATQASTVTVSVGAGSGASLADSFTGFSFEANVLAGTAPSAGNLYQYLKTLGSGVMRFGGNFVDTTFWTSKGEAQPSWAVATLTPADLQRLRTLATNSGWQVVLGVNLKQRDPARAADEAKFAKQILGTSLKAIEIGNEPNYYPNYSMAQYYADFEAYRSAINASAPGVGLVGPSDGRVPAADDWMKDFASRESGHVDIAGFYGHYYPACAKSTPKPTIADLLSVSYRDGEKSRAQLTASLARSLGVPGVLGEGNSVSCEGMDGVSDVFAAALWGVDAQLLYARAGLKGFYLHSSIATCGAPKPLYKAYTPFCAPTDADAAAGNLRVRPVYYSSLLLQQLGSGAFAPVTNSDLTDVRAYALRSGTTLKLVLVNVTDPASHGPLATTIALGGTYTSGSQFQLTAPGLTAQSGILLGGHYVGKGGTFAGVQTTPVTVGGSTLNLNLPAGSATVVTLTP